MVNHRKRARWAWVAVMAGAAAPAYALEGLQDIAVAHEVTRLIVQLGVIILAAKGAGAIAKRVKLPSLLGEVTAGMVLSPYALGAIAVPGFADGLIPLAAGPFSVSIQLYGFAAVGAVLHILSVGLESEPALLALMRPRSVAIALSGSLLALVVGAAVAVRVFAVPIGHPIVLFFAALSVSTSLGVQARILSSTNRLGTPEGAVILRSSLLQDGLAIIVLAIALSVGSTSELVSIGARWTSALPVAGIAFAVLASGFTLVVLATPRMVRSFRDLGTPSAFAIVAVAVTLVVSGVFETFGVAAIIGAYIVGLALARTDVADAVEEKIASVTGFFVPILYVVMGMLIDFRVLFTPEVLIPGVGFALLSGGAKIVGSGVPALLTGFNRLGALRVGLGTVPRGEIALIIAAVGLGSGILSPTAFKVMAVMVVFSVAIGTPALALAFRRATSGTRGSWGRVATVTTALDFPNEELTELVAAGILGAARQDGFFIHRLELADTVYRMRRDELFVSLRQSANRIELVSDPQDAGVAKTLLYEVIIHVRDRVSRITEIVVPEELRRDVASGQGRVEVALLDYLLPDRIAIPLSATDREGVIAELVGRLAAADALSDRQRVLDDVLERERSVSTGMEKGIAIPHAKTEGVDRIVVAVGVAPDGVDFGAVDGLPSRIVFLIASPIESRVPHLQLLASIATRFRDESVRAAALAATDAAGFIDAVVRG